MSATSGASVSRRDFLRASGLIVGFTLAPRLALGQDRPAALPGSLNTNRMLDAWLRIDPSGSVTIFTGKIELGQGIGTALVADRGGRARRALQAHRDDPRRHRADAERGPDRRLALGRAKRHRAALRVRRGARHPGLDRRGEARGARRRPEGERRHHRGAGRRERHVLGPGARGRFQARGDREGEAQAGRRASVGRQEHSPPRHSEEVHGRRRLRAGRAAAKHALRPGGASALAGRASSWRWTRPRPAACRAWSPSCATEASWPSPPSAKSRPFAPREALAKSARWGETMSLPPTGEALYKQLMSSPAPGETVVEKTSPSASAPAKTLEALYTRPFQCHGSIGPSCAVAQWEGQKLTVWTHSQGVFPLRADLAKVFGLKPGDDSLHPRRGLRLLRPQRRRRRGARRGAAGARDRRPAGEAAVDARGRVHVGAVRLGHGDEALGRHRCSRQHRRLVARAVEPPAQHPAGLVGRRQPARGPASGAAVRAGAPGRRPAACRRRGSQRDPALRRSQRRRSSSTTSPRRRCAPRRCGRSAPTPTCSRSSPSWTSWRRRRASIRSSSDCGT